MYINTEYKTDVQIQYGELQELLSWCTKNCLGKWGYEIIEYAGSLPGIYNFKFESKDDYVTFLVWKQ
jgi:hypothetical protein